MNDYIKNTAYRLLTPNDTLDVTLFDVHNKMYPKVREVLLDNAHYTIRQTIGNIEGLETYDICLNGSSASYFYYEKSDIDVRIEIHNKNCPYLSNDLLCFNRFLYTIQSGALQGFKFKLNQRNIDIKLTADQFEIAGLYSILKDKWIIKPKKEFTQNLSVEEVLTEFEKKLSLIQQRLKFFSSKKCLTPCEQNELSDYYTNMIRNNNVSAQDYIIYKLLNYSGIFQEIKKILNDGVKAYLTIG